MFKSFFPRPKLFFLSAAVWGLLCVLLWFFFAKDLGPDLSLAHNWGTEFPADLEVTEIAELEEGADEAATAAHAEAVAAQAEASAAHQASVDDATTMWFYQYQALAYLAFAIFWMFFSPTKWSRWSVLGSTLIIFVVWFQVHVDVMINEWFGEFYDTIQEALAEPGAVTLSEYYGHLFFFMKLAAIAVTVSVLNGFFVKHYVFRWRTAMNDYYMSVWPKVRHIEGASQRVQEDTMRFAGIVEALGVRFIDSVMTLIAFLPILLGLSQFVKVLPVFGEIAHALVWVAVLWSVIGTAILALTGIRLPGLEFRNQRVEAAYRKELVIGEDDAARAAPPTVKNLFNDVRTNYFRLYFNYLYFDVVRYSYLQVGVILPYIVLGPTIIAAGFTLGVMQQTLRAFGRVEGSFQFLVNSWTTIVELMSIYKRLKTFESAIDDKPLPKIDQDFLENQG